MAQTPRVKKVLLEPVAQPVDTFVKAQRPEESNLWQLAQSLKGLDRNLDGFMQQRKAESDDADRLAGEAAFYQNNRAGYDEGVKQGLIPAFASKSFVEAYKTAEGNLLGMGLATKFKTAYDSWDGKNSSDPNAFTGFYQGWLKENIPQSADPAILKGLLPHVRNITQGGQSAFDADRHKNMYSGSVKTHAAIGKQAVDQAGLEGAGNPKGLDTDGLYNTLMGIRTESLKTLRTEDVDKSFVDNITSAALERAKVNHAEARKLLTLLDRGVPGQTRKWSDEPYAREEKGKALGQLDTIWKQAQAENEKRQTQEDRKTLKDAQTGAIQWIIENPGKPIPEEILAKGNTVDGTFRVDAINWQKTVSTSTVAEDPKAVTQLYADILAGGGQGSVRAALSKGIIRDSATLKGAYDFAEKLNDKNSPIHTTLKGPVYDGVRSAIKARTTPDSISNPWAADGMSDAGLNALTDYQLALSRWAIKNPEATDEQRFVAQRTLGEAILGGLPQQASPGDTYKRTPDAASAVGVQPAQPGQPAQPAAPAQAPAPSQPTAIPGDEAAKLRADAEYYAKTNPEAARQFRERADALDRAKVQTPQGAAAAEGRNLPTPSAPQPARQTYTPEQRQQFLQGRTPEERQLLESTASQRGVSVDSLVDGLIRRGEQKQQPSLPAANKRSDLGFDPQTVSSFLAAAGVEVPAILKGLLTPSPANAATTPQPTPNAFGDAIRAAFKANPALAKTGDPATEKLLTFIGGLEAPRGYDQLYSGNKPSERPITSMTLDEVLALQKEQRSGGAKSTALGRYQFIYKTLGGLKRSEGLSGSELFTPQLQDRLASALLERRGYSEWKAGKITTDQFADRLAQEWASLPTDSGGSYYAGDGLNKALASRRRVKKVLGED